MEKSFRWDANKNAWLKANRGFGFETIVEAIENGGLLADIMNPSSKHPKQRLYVVDLEGYAITVPYVKENEYDFLKTAFKNRKANKQFLTEPKL